jgi:hypothetical protein
MRESADMKPKQAVANDDPDFDSHALEEAVEEMTPLEDGEPAETAPEVNEETAKLTEWDQPPNATGAAVPKVPPEDESPVTEILTQEGVEEAERERRIAAADPDYEA